MAQVFPDTSVYNLPCTGFDSHAHLVYPEIFEEIDLIIERATASGVKNIVQMYLSPESYYETRESFEKHKNVFFALGIHPLDVGERYSEEALNTVKHILTTDPRMKALGEIGLDFFKNTNPPDLQEKVLREQLAIAKEYNLPVAIHSRNAFEDTIRILDDMDFKDHPLIWHCFCGNKAQIDIINERAWYISVPASIGYPSNREARADIIHIPSDKLLIETDCPFLSPQGWRGKRNEPSLVVLTAKTIAECRQVPLEELWTECGNNARRIYRIED